LKDCGFPALDGTGQQNGAIQIVSACGSRKRVITLHEASGSSDFPQMAQMLQIETGCPLGATAQSESEVEFDLLSFIVPPSLDFLSRFWHTSRLGRGVSNNFRGPDTVSSTRRIPVVNVRAR